MRLVLIAACLALAACGTTPEKVYLGAQHSFNAIAHAENAYAMQPFCGAEGAPAPPACADGNVVVEMAAKSATAQSALDVANKAIQDPAMEEGTVSAIVSAALHAVGDFGGVLAGAGIPVPDAP